MKISRILSLASVLFLAAAPAFAEGIAIKTVTKNDVPYGKNKGDKCSVSTGVVDAKGTISYTVVVKTNGFLPNDPNVKVRVELRKPDNTLAHGITKLVNNGGTTFQFGYDMLPGEENLGNRIWKVNVINEDTENHRDGKANITIKYPTRKPDVLAVSPSAPLTLLPGQTEVKTFTEGHAGKLTIEAEWVPDFGAVLQQADLRLKLFKPGVDPDTGSAVAQKLGKSKLTMTYHITSADLAAGSKWSLSIHDPSQFGIANFKVKVTFLKD